MSRAVYGCNVAAHTAVVTGLPSSVTTCEPRLWQVLNKHATVVDLDVVNGSEVWARMKSETHARDLVRALDGSNAGAVRARLSTDRAGKPIPVAHTEVSPVPVRESSSTAATGRLTSTASTTSRAASDFDNNRSSRYARPHPNQSTAAPSSSSRSERDPLPAYTATTPPAAAPHVEAPVTTNLPRYNSPAAAATASEKPAAPPRAAPPSPSAAPAPAPSSGGAGVNVLVQHIPSYANKEWLLDICEGLPPFIDATFDKESKTASVSYASHADANAAVQSLCGMKFGPRMLEAVIVQSSTVEIVGFQGICNALLLYELFAPLGAIAGVSVVNPDVGHVTYVHEADAIDVVQRSPNYDVSLPGKNLCLAVRRV